MVRITFYRRNSGKVHAISNETYRSYCGASTVKMTLVKRVITDFEGHGLDYRISEVLDCKKCRKYLYKYLNPQKFKRTEEENEDKF